MRISDWSSDVCSSDLRQEELRSQQGVRRRHRQSQPPHAANRQRLDAGGAWQVPDRATLRDLQRRAPEARGVGREDRWRSEEHTSELQSLMRISYAVFCLKKKIKSNIISKAYITSGY